MKYTVVWTAAAEARLAAIWNDAADRRLIAKVAESLDRELAHNPSAAGESRPNAQRIAHCLPLGIRFEILEEDRLVRVLTVWRCRHQKK